MSNSEPDWREREYDPSQYKTAGQIAVVILVLLVGIVIGASLFAGDEPLIEDTGYWTNLFTEVISVIVTVGFIGLIFEYRRKEQLKKDLVQQTKRRSNDTVLDAIDALRENGWLTGEKGVLQGADLTNANLQGANLEGANLKSAVLKSAKLQNAFIYNATLEKADLQYARLDATNLCLASLQGANLRWAKLQKAEMSRADLKGADLGYSNLKNADLSLTNVCGINLGHANLEGTHWGGTELCEHVKLPDQNKWRPGTDMGRFTDPNHPRFWTPPKWVKDEES